MRAMLFGLFLVLILGTPVAAQTGPAITEFTYDGIPLGYDEVEQGIASAVFSWRAVNVAPPYRMQMHALVGGRWVLIGEDFAPVKSDTLVIAHPLSFSLPTYRLSIVDAGGVIVDEARLALAYAATDPDGAPQITSFSVLTPDSISRQALAAGAARLTVAWEVSNRLANTNLIFEQVMPDLTWRSVDLPRLDSWVRSVGSGEVAPVDAANYSETGQYPITLQIRLVDIATGVTLSWMQTTVAVTDDAGDVFPTPAPTATYEPSLHHQITFETPYLVTLGSSMTVSWDASPEASVADEVVIREWHNLYYGGKYGTQAGHVDNAGETPAREWSGLPLQGELTLDVPPTYPAGSLPNGDPQNVVVFSLYVRQGGQDVGMGGIQRLVYLRTLEQATSCTPSISGPQQVPSGEVFRIEWDACGLPFVRLQVTPDSSQTFYPYFPLYGEGSLGLAVNLYPGQQSLEVRYALLDLLVEHTVVIVPAD